MTRMFESEAGFQAAVVELAELTGWRTFHPHDSRRSNPGWPDLVLARPPVTIVAELKTEQGRVSVEQTEWLDALNACGIRAVVWRPEDWPAIERLLSARRPKVPDMSQTWARIRALHDRAMLADPALVARDYQRMCQLRAWFDDAGLDFDAPIVRHAVARAFDVVLINLYLERGLVPSNAELANDVVLNMLAGISISTLPSEAEV